VFENFIVPPIARLQARSGEPFAAPASFRAMLQSWPDAAEALQVSHGIGGLVVPYPRLCRHEATVLTHGMLDKAFPSNPIGEELTATKADVRRTLGQAAFEHLSRRGAAMDLHEVIDYTEGEIARALAELGRAQGYTKHAVNDGR